MAGISVSFIVHYVSFMLSLAVLTLDYTYMDLPTHYIYAGRCKYLTFLSFVTGLMYYNMAAIFDFMIWSRGRDSELWKGIRDFVFTTVVFPLAMFVCSMFWILYLANPSFMRSPEEDKLIPFWMNHGYHTLPIVTAFIQAYTVHHNYPGNRMAFISLLVCDSLYLGWLFWIAHYGNFWVYPIFERMSLIGVLMFVTVSAAINFGLYFVGKKFSDAVWSSAKTKTS